MPKLVVNQEKVTEQSAGQLQGLCPFSAFAYENGLLSITAGCKMCRLCVKSGPEGVVTLVEDTVPRTSVNKEEWQGVAVFAEQQNGVVAPVVLELLGKARELASVLSQPVTAVLIGSGMEKAAQALLSYGADRVYVYDDAALAHFLLKPYASCFENFIRKTKPGSVLVGATNLGRSLAARMAARFKTGLTADCTRLEMKPNSDLVQIRPAFGGNIMARIVTPGHRPQFCTVRYKVFEAAAQTDAKGIVRRMEIQPAWLKSDVRVLKVEKKAGEADISEAEVIVAVGRGIKNEKELEGAKQLAAALNAQLACTRPLIENGWFDAKKQIGLSGRAVKPKLIITLGISGSVQFVAGMQGAERIIAVNSDENAPVFDIAHMGLLGDLSHILPLLLKKIEEEKARCAK